MATVALKSWDGKDIKNIEIPDAVFAAKIKEHLVHEVVVAQMAERRAGTACTKTRGLVRGGGKKPWRQKGTGRARAGSIRSPIWRGGGTVFGPQPRSYHKDVPKKVRKSALCSVLSDKFQNNRLVVLDKIEMAEYKTKKVQELLTNLKCDGKTLLVTEKDSILRRSTRNMTGAKALDVGGINVYDILNAQWLVITQDALKVVEGVLGNA